MIAYGPREGSNNICPPLLKKSERGNENHKIGWLVMLRGIVLARRTTKYQELDISSESGPEISKEQGLLDQHPITDVGPT